MGRCNVWKTWEVQRPLKASLEWINRLITPTSVFVDNSWSYLSWANDTARTVVDSSRLVPTTPPSYQRLIDRDIDHPASAARHALLWQSPGTWTHSYAYDLPRARRPDPDLLDSQSPRTTGWVYVFDINTDCIRHHLRDYMNHIQPQRFGTHDSFSCTIRLKHGNLNLIISSLSSLPGLRQVVSFFYNNLRDRHIYRSHKSIIPTPEVTFHYSHLKPIAHLIQTLEHKTPVMTLLECDILRMHKEYRQINSNHNIPYAHVRVKYCGCRWLLSLYMLPIFGNIFNDNNNNRGVEH